MSKTLSSPIVRVLVERDGSNEFTEYTVQTDNRDMVQWDVIRARKSWPTLADAPMLGFTAIAWNALRRSGAIGTQNLDDFMSKCVEATIVDRDGNPVTKDNADEAGRVDPTQPVPDPGY